MATPVAAKITDHSTKAIERLPGYQQDATNWGKLLRALNVEIQALEDALDSLLNQRHLAVAIGAQLDGLGTIMDLAREGRTDADYRAALQNRATELANSGEADVILTSYKFLTAAPVVTLIELQPATCEVTAFFDIVESLTAQQDATIIAAMQKIKAAGVQLILLVVQDLAATPGVGEAFLWGDEVNADGNGDITADPDKGLGDVVDLKKDGTITAIGSGSAVGDAGTVTGSLTMALSGSTVAGDYVYIYISGRGSSYVFTAPDSTWEEVFQFNGSPDPNTIAMFSKIVAAGEPSPTVSWTGGVLNGTVIGQTATIRPSAGSTIVPIARGGQSANGSAVNIGPISPITSNLVAGDILLVVGHRADDWTTVATLSGDGQTWTEIGDNPTTLGDDAGTVWDFAILVGSPPVITAKTFVVTGGAAASGIGIMASFRVTKGDIDPGPGQGGNFARVIN